ncbi:hypothetical protein Aab01nite_77240 [Paractinoplanes abujensis]|uniref:Uncharacterized protein n=1 Tax=Paractinoplanes abujensis TaxID=882441 RepID=A0A7W7CQ64_9ACTN|nr:hypothetical protein [Actinoplanes abujensis]MBB4692389.1 hypothetical protein [Actinoplanes abujensis]GID24134.1 hypothetical protein Aab01nite_77240 [Actinoplanes abujensis]
MTEERGVVEERAVLDLSHLTSPDQLAAISRISAVGAVVLPEALAGAYAGIPVSEVGATIFVPDGLKVRVHVGPLVVGGDGIGAAGEMLVVVGVLVVTGLVTGELPGRISVVGSVFAPRGSEAALGRVLGGGAGTVTYYRYQEGQSGPYVKMLSGQVRLTGAALANPAGEATDILIVAGQIIITGEVGSVGYGQIFAAGQIIAPEAAQAELETRMEAQGQLIWYRSGDPRVFYDDTELGPDYFRLLDHPVSLIVLGDLTLGAGVTPGLLRESVTDMVVLGDVHAPSAAVPAVQVLATDLYGEIRVADGPRG